MAPNLSKKRKICIFSKSPKFLICLKVVPQITTYQMTFPWNRMFGIFLLNRILLRHDVPSVCQKRLYYCTTVILGSINKCYVIFQVLWLTGNLQCFVAKSVGANFFWAKNVSLLFLLLFAFLQGKSWNPIPLFPSRLTLVGWLQSWEQPELGDNKCRMCRSQKTHWPVKNVQWVCWGA